jgi:hypothetical protein
VWFSLVFQNNPKCPEQALLLEVVSNSLFVVNVQVFQGFPPPAHYDGEKPIQLRHETLAASPASACTPVCGTPGQSFYGLRQQHQLLIKELKGARGLGQQQVTKYPHWVERSIAISVMAYLVIVKFHAQEISERGSWSFFTLQRNFTWQLAQAQLERSAKQRLRKELQECNEALSPS